MKNLEYYDRLETPHISIAKFIEERDEELDSFVGTRAELKTKEDTIVEESRQKFRENQKRRNNERTAKRQEFKNDLAKDNGIALNHPKLDLLFNMAWEHGHSNGLYEVQTHFEGFLELIK